jgi:hypothetical protein
MKHKVWRNILILITPFLIMILVNESVRLAGNQNSGIVYGVKTISPVNASDTDCSWACYYNTSTHCKQHHVKFMQPLFRYIDVLYFGEIKFLHQMGDYAVANIIFMVILWPGLMYFLFITFLNQGEKLKKLKEKN